jgi:AcrR family transcriptional regulator
MDSAEELFSKHGPNGVALRAVVDHARANIAAINYYFGSKEALFDAVVARSIERLALGLGSALTAAAAGSAGAPPVEDIIAAFLRGGLSSELKGYLRLRTWMGLVDPQRAAELLALHFDAVTDRYLAALGNRMPALSRAELGWRLYLITAALVFTAFDANRLESLTGGEARASDTAAVIAHVAPLLANGIGSNHAPPVKPKAAKPKRAKSRGGSD